MDDAENGRHEKAKRGATLLRSGRGNKSLCAVRATTAEADAKPGAMFRFTNRPYFSVTGDQYSQRKPALIVKPG